MERCENCGRDIGNLETPVIWNGTSVVCKKCSQILNADNSPPIQTIEKTSKIWKVFIITGQAILISGFTLIFVGFNKGWIVAVIVGIVLASAGFLLSCVGGICAYWYNG